MAPAGRAGLAGGAALVLALASMPWWAESGLLRTGGEFLYFVALAQLWNLLAGYGGIVSFGQQAFIGIGAYSIVLFAYRLGLNPFLAVPLGAAICGLLAWPMSKLLFRLQGAYFAVGTWIMAECWRLIFANWSWLGGGTGISVTDTVRDMDFWWREALTFWLALALGAGAIAGIYAVLRSRHGLALTAMRDSEIASESLGVSVARLKLWVYIAAAAGFGLVGGLICITKLRISPDSAFTINWSVMVVFMVVVGGIGTIEGPIIGVIVFFLLREYLADLGSIYLIAFGLLAILVMLTMRDGIWGYIRRRWDFSFFPVQRRVPAGRPAAPPG